MFYCIFEAKMSVGLSPLMYFFTAVVEKHLLQSIPCTQKNLHANHPFPIFLYHPKNIQYLPHLSSQFQKFSAAAEVLMDSEKREVYDKYGKEGLSDEGGGGGGGGAEDILSQMFGGRGGGGGRSRGPQKGEDIRHSIKVSLEDLYNGKTVRLAISRNKPCNDCNGVGGKKGAEKTCDVCSGRGVRVTLRQIGPGMVQQMQSACSACKGEGKAIDERDKCKGCKGQKVMKDRKVLEVHIEKGMKNGHKIKFTGEADEIPGTVPGDVVITVQEKEHEALKRLQWW